MKACGRTVTIGLLVAGILAGMPLSEVPALAAAPTPGGDAWDGEAVDLSTGLFVHHTTDLYATDGMPVALVRTMGAGAPGVFGLGGSHAYELQLSAAPPYQHAQLLLPDGNAIAYARVTPGDEVLEAVFEPSRAPTAFHGSTVDWSGGWRLRTADATFYQFDQQGRLERVTDPFGRVAEILRADTPQGSGLGPITRITSPSGRWIALAYDGAGRIVQARDIGGRLVTYTYDGSGRLASVTDPENGVTRYTYDTSHRILTIAGPRGFLRIANEYDADGRVVQQIRADQTTYRFAYALDTRGKVVRADVTGPRDAVRRVVFDPNGYRSSDTRALGTPVERTVTYERDASGFVSSVTDALGRRTMFTYDARGLVTAVTRLAGSAEASTTALSYVSAGSLGIPRLESITDPLGHVTSFSYDGQGFPAGVVDPLGLRTRLTVLNGSVVQIADPLGNATALSHAGGNLTSIIDPLGRITARGYDAWARLTSETDPLGKRTAATYDRLDRVTQITDAAGGATRFAYDAGGNVLSVTDARGKVTRYAYDSMNRVTRRTDPLQRSETYTYDPGGNLISMTDRNGQTTAFTYDALNRLVAAVYADGSTTTYTWDAANRLVEIADSVSGVIARSYDRHDRLLAETTPQGTIRSGYDAAGWRTALAVDGEPAVAYGYDAAGRLTRIARAAGVVDVAHDDAGRRTALTLPNGITAEYAYDAGSQLTALTYRRGPQILGTLTYAYDAAGRRVRASGTWARLALPEAVISATHDDANRPLTFGPLALAHDANGNLLSDGSNTYTWDARNRLVAIDGPEVMAGFVHDSLGRRQAAQVDARASWFLYDGADAVHELGAMGAVTSLGGDGLDHPVARWDDDGLLVLLTDGFGSVIALADETGAVLAEYTYAPFGAAAGHGAVDLSPYGFAGGEDDGSGLQLHGPRYYHPRLQRFLGEDPRGFSAGDTNLYTYARNNPVAVHHRTPATRLSLPEWTTAGAVTVDTAPITRLLNIPASPEHRRALRDPVVAAGLERTGGWPLPSPRTPERLLAGPPSATDPGVRSEAQDGGAATLPVSRRPFAVRVR